MAASLSHAQKRFIGTEIVIGTLLGSVLPATAMFFTMGPFPMPFWGDEGMALFLVKNALGMGTVMTLLMTLAVRMRVRKGSAPILNWTRQDQAIFRLIPRSILLRAPLFGLIAVVLLGVPGIGVAMALGIQTIERLSFSLYMGANSAGIALVLIPLILMGALSDAIPPRQTEPVT